MISLIETVKDYIESMLGELQGRKALIMDKETLGNQFVVTQFEYSYCLSRLFSYHYSAKGGILH